MLTRSLVQDSPREMESWSKMKKTRKSKLRSSCEEFAPAISAYEISDISLQYAREQCMPLPSSISQLSPTFAMRGAELFGRTQRNPLSHGEDMTELGPLTSVGADEGVGRPLICCAAA